MVGPKETSKLGFAPIDKASEVQYRLVMQPERWQQDLGGNILRFDDQGRDVQSKADTAQKTLSHLIQKIRRKYRSDVPIIVRLDSGFFDQKLLQVLETLEVGYIVAGKLYGDVQQYILQLEETAWGVSRNGDQEWHYVELGDRRGSWDKFRRALFCRPAYENRQRLLAFARPDQILYTNLGCGCAVERGCSVGFKRKPFCKAIRDGEPTS